MPARTGKAIAAKWARNLGQAQNEMKDGVTNLDTSPTELAAQKEQKMLAGVTDAVNSGRWAKGLRAWSKQAWADAYIKKGIPRIQAGATTAQPVVEQFGDFWMAYEAEGQRRLDAMPNDTPQQRDQRLLFMVNWNRDAKGKFQKRM